MIADPHGNAGWIKRVLLKSYVAQKTRKAIISKVGPGPNASIVVVFEPGAQCPCSSRIMRCTPRTGIRKSTVSQLSLRKWLNLLPPVHGVDYAPLSNKILIGWEVAPAYQRMAFGLEAEPSP